MAQDFATCAGWCMGSDQAVEYPGSKVPEKAWPWSWLVNLKWCFPALLFPIGSQLPVFPTESPVFLSLLVTWPAQCVLSRLKCFYLFFLELSKILKKTVSHNPCNLVKDIPG